MSGKDTIQCGGGPDGFLFQDPNNFGKKERDTILDFKPEEGDSLLIDNDVFDFGRKLKVKTVKNKKRSKEAR